MPSSILMPTKRKPSSHTSSHTSHIPWASPRRIKLSESRSYTLCCNPKSDSEGAEKEVQDIFTPPIPTTTPTPNINTNTNTTALTDPASRRLLNFFLLFSSFSYVLYTILTIDAGSSRGWTLQESLYRMPYDNWRNYEDALELAPVETKTAINVVIYLLGDWLSQTIFRKGDPLTFDASRTLKNGLIGACFGPAVHLYYEWSDAILPVEEGFNRLFKILMDQTLYLGVKCSVYIAAVGLLNGEAPGEVSAAGLPGEIGVSIVAAPTDSDLAKAGLREGDVILECSDRDINTVAELFAAFSASRAGGKLKLEIIRAQQRTKIELPRPATVPPNAERDAP